MPTENLVLAHYGSRRVHVTCVTQPLLHLVDFKCASKFWRGTGIRMAKNKPREFYVVITNVSGGPQSIWQYWNSWGYQAISFGLTTADGKKFVLSKKQEAFTVNFPSTFVVQPGEHQVYPIKLDEWETHPALPKTDEMPITLKAVYEVSTTPEASQYKVWTGRLESRIS